MLASLGLELPAGFAEITWTHIVSTIAVIGVFSNIVKRLRGRRYLTGVPEPSGPSLLWGHQWTVFEKPVGRAYADWMDELHAQVYRIRGALFNPDVLVVGDPLAMTHILQKHVYDYPHSRLVQSRIGRILGESLGWVEGEAEHKRMRALIAPSLSPEALRTGTTDLYIVAERLADNIRTQILEGSNSKCEVDILEWVSQATLEATGRLGFGHDFEGGYSDDAQKILGAWKSMARLSISPAAFFALALIRRFPFLNHLPLHTLRVQGEVLRTIHKCVAKELLRRNRMDSPDIKGNDLLSRLCIAQDSGVTSTHTFMDHVSTFIVAGSETTAQSLAYAIWELSRHPEIQSKLREEVMSFGGSPSYDDLQNQLPYLNAVTREVLRMHPAAPSIERVAIKDDVLPLRHPVIGKDGKVITSVHVSAGQTVVLPIHAMNRMHSVWEGGSDFRPERWAEELPRRDLCTGGWSRLVTFSDGPRNCIGFRLAVLQFKIVLFTLLQRFKFEDTGAEIIDRVASTVQPVVVGEEDKGPRLPIKVSFL